jgi:diacylglycerol kinase family enzyme
MPAAEVAVLVSPTAGCVGNRLVRRRPAGLPGRHPTDGAFDVTVVGPVGRRELVRTRPRLTAGTHVGHPAVTVHRARRVELAGEGLCTYADGEPVAPLPAASVCVPGALSVVGTGRCAGPPVISSDHRRGSWLTTGHEPGSATTS